MAKILMTRQEWTANRLEAWTNTRNATGKAIAEGLEAEMDARALETAWTDFTSSSAQCRILAEALEALEDGDDPLLAMLKAVPYCGDPRVGAIAASDLIRQWEGCIPE
jgi:hypothetical protein